MSFGDARPSPALTVAAADLIRASARICGRSSVPERDREVLHRPLRLRLVLGVLRYPDLAHRVVLDAVFDVRVGAVATAVAAAA